MFFKRSGRADGPGCEPSRTRGIIIFPSVEEALKAEKIIQRAGHECRLVAPPPHLRQGCDLALEVELIEQTALVRALEGKVAYLGLYPLEGSAEMLRIVKVVSFPRHVMVKAGNMKLTYDRSSGVIVNLSGGGCPDVPYLYTRLVGRKLEEVDRPREIGFTLCALMLDRAWEEALALWKGGEPN
ncbi:MAG: putative Se/S carrier-like protein [Moorellaceae bacterium]